MRVIPVQQGWLSAFFTLHTIPQQISARSILHFVFRILLSAFHNSAFYQDPIWANVQRIWAIDKMRISSNALLISSTAAGLNVSVQNWSNALGIWPHVRAFGHSITAMHFTNWSDALRIWPIACIGQMRLTSPWYSAADLLLQVLLGLLRYLSLPFTTCPHLKIELE